MSPRAGGGFCRSDVADGRVRDGRGTNPSAITLESALVSVGKVRPAGQIGTVCGCDIRWGQMVKLIGAMLVTFIMLVAVLTSCSPSTIGFQNPTIPVAGHSPAEVEADTAACENAAPPGSDERRRTYQACMISRNYWTYVPVHLGLTGLIAIPLPPFFIGPCHFSGAFPQGFFIPIPPPPGGRVSVLCLRHLEPSTQGLFGLTVGSGRRGCQREGRSAS